MAELPSWQSYQTLAGFIFVVWFMYTFMIELGYPGIYWKLYFQYTIVMLYASLYQTVRIGPGYVESEFTTKQKEEKQDAKESDSTPSIEVVIDSNATPSPNATVPPPNETSYTYGYDEVPRFCDLCKAFKPARSHHCSKCKRCILRRDHHCPWTGGCIGEQNYKFYILILLYGSTAALNILIVLFFPFIDTLREDDFLDKEWRVILLYIYVILVGGGCFYLLYYHIGLITHNMTTMEVLAAYRDEDYDHELHNKYNKGLHRNLIEVLGDDPAFWLVPIPFKNKKE